MKYIHGVLFWIKFTVLTITLSIFLAVMRPIFVLRGRAAFFSRFVHNTAKFWGRTIIRTTPGWSVEVFGKENIPAEPHKFVIVSNHESMTDIWVLFLLDFQFRWLSKAEVFKIPFLGPGMRWAGYIPIERGNKESHAEALERSAASVNEGVPMLYFPEGTRSDGGPMRPFKIGAFKLAADAGTRVLPVAIKGTRTMIPKKSWLPSPSRVRIQILPPVARQPGEDLDVFAARTRDMVLQAIEKL